LFFAGFLQGKLRFFSETRIKIFYNFYVQTRNELNKWVVFHALSPRAEPLPEYGREGMEAIRGFYRKLADDEGKVQFHANHPSKYFFLLLNRTVSRFRVHFDFFYTVQFKIRFSASLSVSFFLIVRFHSSLRLYGSGFEPFSILFFTVN
jgi:hypothetical protein